MCACIQKKKNSKQNLILFKRDEIYIGWMKTRACHVPRSCSPESKDTTSGPEGWLHKVWQLLHITSFKNTFSCSSRNDILLRYKEISFFSKLLSYFYCLLNARRIILAWMTIDFNHPFPKSMYPVHSQCKPGYYSGKRRLGTLWTGCQSIAGLAFRHRG